MTNFTHPRMHLFGIPQWSIQNINVHISVLNEALWDMKQVHSGICELVQLSCFRIIFLSGEKPEQRAIAYKQNNQLPVALHCIGHKYCCYTKYGGIIAKLTLWNPWGILLICQNATVRVCGAWFQIFSFYVQNHIAPIAALFWTPLVCDGPLGAPAFLKLAYWIKCSYILYVRHQGDRQLIFVLALWCNVAAFVSNKPYLMSSYIA